MLNKNIVHLIDDIYWNMGFKAETQADKVMPIIRVVYIIRIISIVVTYTFYTHYLQVRQDLGLADHVWQDKRALIAQSVDNLGDQFRPAMRAGWLSYIRRAYPENDAADAGPVVGEGTFVVDD